MRIGKLSGSVAALALLASCGGNGNGGGGSGAPIGGGPVTPPVVAPPVSGCALSARQSWAFGQLDEWYLFPELFDRTINPALYSSVQAYIDALVAPARAQARDRFFTYITSIAEENAFFNAGQSAGFGIRLSYDTVASRLFVVEAYEGAPAFAAGIDRGTEILAIGTSSITMVTVAQLFAQGGAQAVSDALGPTDAGVTRTLRIRAGGVEREVQVTKAEFAIQPVSSRYGAKVIDDGGRKVGYVNLRTFIDTADPALRSAFASFRSQGITEVIVDVRYNGGGLVSIAELMGDLLNASRVGQVFSYTTFRPEKAVNNETDLFGAQPQAIAATKIAFIATTASASASELVINSQIPYSGANAGLIGTNTYGKPVGQIALDRAECDDRLRAVAFRTENANHQGDYYTGLASKVQASCQAGDDITRQLGDPAESSVRVALDFLAGRSCTPLTAGGVTTQAAGGRRLLEATAPSAAQYELPGLF